ncbi:D-alanyl-D-alanine carboxypeptidase/D-alanyl-D-alanine-endopeptidase [Flavisolibacter ginsenosidimutans]|uniref:D-alanyl-D-alanine carboxypeptidase/D-alanyl-D-alanine-endopeptidase n=2 Tax=Flavisolibacter ginsenosidimutans TaxID=661481 RepID=A0A5B8UPR0_9BACT|nr:D-alanyl-D-alanine carboxypeptidase/D-alanyl-D-alanine-endopeptidase [Flavisolibacter ginsenosidimutans]
MYKRMKRTFWLLIVACLSSQLHAQTASDNLAKAWSTFEADSQLQSAVASIYVIDESSGAVVFDRNSRIGLAPASTQKIITAAAAYEVLGKDFRFQTKFGYYSGIKRGRLAGSIVVLPSGDPTLGSWRWKSTTEDSVTRRIVKGLAQTGIQFFNGFSIDESGKDEEAIPGGWIWEDIGNYYGAGATALNWRENQYDLILKSGKNIGDSVLITGTKPALYDYSITSKLKAAAKGTGDNSVIYFPVTTSALVVRGTIPAGEERFVVSGAMPSPNGQFLATLTDSLARRGIAKEGRDETVSQSNYDASKLTVFHTEVSPPLDSMSYWFLKRSINLYGEAFAKRIAIASNHPFTSEDGANVIANLWSNKGIGIDRNELHTYDGSGLSPLNRVTTHAQVSVLQYAKKQAWFSGYFSGFPEFNGMKLKSGTINRVKSFCGYHTSKAGKSYIVSYIVNNYNGASSSLVQKMYKVLNELK